MFKGFILALLVCSSSIAQSSDAMREVLERLSKLEEQNRALTKEVQELRERLGTAGTPADSAPLAERVEVAEQRVAELDQTRVATENKLPVTLTGMVLFNAYLNGQASAGAAYPAIVPATGRASGGGATLRQSVLGLRFDGPSVLGGAKVKGAIFMDFFGGGTGLNQTMRLRTASLNVEWKNTTAGFAFDKPIIAPRDPDSLAQVGVSPLTGAGNLWLWQPQVRVEHRLSWKDRMGVRAQAGVYQTAEERVGAIPAGFTDTLAASRPGYEGRFEVWAQRGGRRIEIAPGFHVSSTRVIGRSVPSRLFTIDWLVRPMARVDLTGAFFSGQNASIVGGIRQGVNFSGTNSGLNPTAVHSKGGWAQLKIRATQRATINLFAGQQDDRNRDLLREGIAKNQAHGANIMYRWGPNVMTGFEASQVRTSYFGNIRINPHYDLAIAYLF